MSKTARSLVYDVKEVRSFRELIQNSATEYADRPAFVFRDEGDFISSKSYAEYFEEIKCLTSYLHSLGLEGKRVAVVGRNCYEWTLAYLAVTCGTGVVVPIDKDLKKDDVAGMVTDSECSAVIYVPGSDDLVEALDPSVVKICTGDFVRHLETGRRLRESGDLGYENHHVDPYGLGVLIYTSATTGVAKGVMLSQYNICSNVFSVRKGVLVRPEDRALSVLPLHHTYECTTSFLTVIYSGASLAFVQSFKRLLSDLAFYAPTVMCAVPLLLQNIYDNIVKKYHSISGGQLIFAAAKGAAKTAGMIGASRAGRRLFPSVHKAFGGRLRLLICGAAPLSPKLFKDYNDMGFDIYIGYGLTEASPICLMHSDFVKGSGDDIGKPMTGVRAKIADESENGIGELAVSGPNIMLGYYNSPQQTEKVLRDGWLYTGDLVCIDKKSGNYKIVGRSKNVIVNQGGKNIYPEELEYLLQSAPVIGECLVYGVDDPKSNDTLIAASVFPDAEIIRKKLSASGLQEDSEEYKTAAEALIFAAIKEINKGMPSVKWIRRVHIREEEFVKTSTRKIKRGSAANKADYDSTVQL